MNEGKNNEIWQILHHWQMKKISLLCFDEISQSAGCEYYTRQIFMLSFQSFVYVTVDNIRIKKSWPLLSLVYCSTDSVQTNLQN